MAITSQFTLSERNGLVYKPHPRFLAQNLSEKVRLIHESLRYFLFSQIVLICWTKMAAAAFSHHLFNFVHKTGLVIFGSERKLEMLAHGP